MTAPSATPRAAIIIPCFNSGQFLAEAVESALAQSYPHTEVIIVNDGSTDPGTRDVLATYETHPRVQTIHQPNFGLSAARNAGIRATDAEYILPLDADDIIDPRYVSEAVEALIGDDDVRLVYCRARLFGTRDEEWNLPDFSWRRILVHNQIFCSNVYRRADWERVGGYDPGFRFGREDHDLILRLLSLGGHPVRLEGVYFHYRQTGRSMNDRLSSSRTRLVDVSARLMRNSSDLYLEHAEDLFSFIFDQHDQIMDLRNRYRLLEAIRIKFPRTVRVLWWALNKVASVRTARGRR